MFMGYRCRARVARAAAEAAAPVAMETQSKGMVLSNFTHVQSTQSGGKIADNPDAQQNILLLEF